MNQQGALSGNRACGQNGRGGLFYVIDNKDLFDGVTNLIKGDAAPTKAARNRPSSKASCFSPLT